MLLVGPPALGSMVEEGGFPFRAGGEPPEAEVAFVRERLPILAAADASVLGNRELFGRMATRAMLPGMAGAFESWAPEHVLREPCEYSSAVLALRTETPSVQIAISLAEAEVGSIKTAAPALEEHQAGLVEALFAMPYLTRFPESLDPLAFPSTTRFRVDECPPSRPLPEWWASREGPLVYVSFGTVLGYMSHAAVVFQAVLKAVADLDARVLLTVGRKFDAAALGRVPANAHVEAWVDQDSVMSHANVVVCHGGSGTVLGALESGVPLVTVPVFADQFENSRRVAAVGAGRTVEVHSRTEAESRAVVTKDDAPRIRAEVDRVLSDSSYGDRARLIAREMAAYPTVEQVMDEFVP